MQGRRQRRLAVVDAPSGLGLRRPAPGSVPGCHKAPAVLRRLGVVERLGAEDGGAVVPGSYRGEMVDGQVRNEREIGLHAIQLADRIEGIVAGGAFPLVLGGDCSILVGVGLALQRRGRHALAVFDGLDYRHSGNTPGAALGGAGGESLALVTGRGAQLAGLEGRRPYVDPGDVIALGVRTNDEYLDSATSDGITVVTAPGVIEDRLGCLELVLRTVGRADHGFWIHLDVDVIDPVQMPAVDSPEPDGLDPGTLVSVVRTLVASPGAVGMDVTIYDPDRDPELRHGREIVDMLASVFEAT